MVGFSKSPWSCDVTLSNHGLFMETTNCNLCGSRSVDHEIFVSDWLLGRSQVVARLVQCRACGLLYQNPRPTLSEMAGHYPPEYESYTDPMALRWLNPLLRQAFEYGLRKRVRFVTKHKPSGGRLLDVGCASGVFLNSMKALETWVIKGVEPNAQVAEYARRKYGLDVVTGTLEKARFPQGYFDCVTMWDVLEHVHSPLDTLLEINRILKDDGILLVRVPNLASWDARLFRQTWAGLDAPRHLYIFTPETLAAMLAQAGFQVIELSCGIGGYVTFVLSLRFWMAARNLPLAIQKQIVKALYHPIARLVSAPLFWIPAALKRGPLMVVIAQKRHRQEAKPL